MEPIKKTLSALPHTPGIYLFYASSGELLYVGKAKDLKKRVSQYFSRDDAVGEKTQQLVAQIARIDTKQTVSEFDALMLEASMIRTHLPKYNVIAKDDKSPIYLHITDEKLPRIIVTRKPKSSHHDSLVAHSSFFGPFQSGRVLRSLLHDIRRIVPYCTSKERRGKPCFYTHIGLCRPCPSVISTMEKSETRDALVREYRAHIAKIRKLFAGKSVELLKELEKDMYTYAKQEQFEKAAETKTSIEQLRHVLTRHYDPSLYLASDLATNTLLLSELASLQALLQPYYPAIALPIRIECIDISNLQGQQATGSLVVLTDGVADTSWYRRFRMKTKGPNDAGMIREVLTRRLKHLEWPAADLLLIDGGKSQVGAAQAVLREHGVSLPVIGLAKRQEEIIVPQGEGWATLTIPLNHTALHVLQRIRDEAHRFALSYHRLLRKKANMIR